MASPREVNIEGRKRVFDDFFKVDEVLFRHTRVDGKMSDTIRYLTFERGDSVAAVLFNRDTDRVILVEQFRLPTYEKGPGWILETVAGMVGAGETPEQTVRREILEETGYEAHGVRPISTFYVSPGGSSERIVLYFAEVGSGDRAAAGGGSPEENEDIRVVDKTVDEVEQLLATGQIQDAKTIIGLMWLMNERRRA